MFANTDDITLIPPTCTPWRPFLDIKCGGLGLFFDFWLISEYTDIWPIAKIS